MKTRVCKSSDAVATHVESPNVLDHPLDAKTEKIHREKSQDEKRIHGHPFNAFTVQPPTIQLRKSL